MMMNNYYHNNNNHYFNTIDSNPLKRMKLEEEIFNIDAIFPQQSLISTSGEAMNHLFDFPPSPSPPSEDHFSSVDLKLNEFADALSPLSPLSSSLELARVQQKNIFLPMNENDFNQLNSNLKEIKNNIENIQNELKKIFNNVLLNPKQLSLIEKLNDEVNIYFIQVNLYYEELQFLFLEPSIPRSIAKLSIIKSPFPKTVKKNIKATTENEKEDPIIVQLFSSPRTEIHPITRVKATLISDDYKKSKNLKSKNNNNNNNGSIIINNEQEIDQRTGMAIFKDLKFSNGTGVAPVKLKFSILLECKVGNLIKKMEIETEKLSEAFIVVTNENQWDESEKKLICLQVFNEGSSASWFKLANFIQIHYLRGTRQLIDLPNRAISQIEFDYLKKKFFKEGNLLVEIGEFSLFWDGWFGPVLHKIRHHKIYTKLWLSGIIFGMITREETNEYLQNQPIGSFLLRFSERGAGKIAIAVNKSIENENGSTNKIIHVIFDENLDSKSLPDFLKEANSLKYLITRQIEFYDRDFKDLKNDICKIVHKDQILLPFYSKSKEVDLLSGYFSSVNL